MIHQYDLLPIVFLFTIYISCHVIGAIHFWVKEQWEKQNNKRERSMRQ